MTENAPDWQVQGRVSLMRVHTGLSEKLGYLNLGSLIIRILLLMVLS